MSARTIENAPGEICRMVKGRFLEWKETEMDKTIFCFCYYL